jgi:hypothetical protein
MDSPSAAKGRAAPSLRHLWNAAGKRHMECLSPVPNSGEIYREDERLPTRDPWIAHLAYIMDGAIPIGRWSMVSIP